MKLFKDLGFSDSFMFGKVMEDPALCRRVLETLLQTEIGELSTPLREKEVKITKGGKAIRLDVFARSINDGVIYDAEMQNRNGQSLEYMSLPKRSRYYQSVIDTNELKTEAMYSELADTNIIFICTFDPFERGNYRYSFREYCEEIPGFFHPSGTGKVYFNTTSDAGGIPQKVRNLFDYINNGTVSDILTGDLEKMVEKIKLDGDSYREYMMQNLFRADAIREGRWEGRAEGRIRTLADGLRNGVSEDMLRTGFDASEEDIEAAKAMLEQQG